MPAVKPSYPRLRLDHTLAQGLVGCWPMYEGSGPALNDLSGQGNNGAFSGGVTWGVGQSGYALSFNGTTGIVNCGTVPGLNGAAQASMSGWIFRSSTSQPVGFGGAAGSSAGGNRFGFRWNTSGQLIVIAESTVLTAVFGSVPLAGTGWHHVAAVYDGTQTGNATRLLAYIDGVQQALTFSPTTIPATLGTVCPFILGKTSSDQFNAGTIDSVAVHNRPLSPAEIAALYADSFQMVRPRRARLKASGGGVTAQIWPYLDTGLCGSLCDMGMGGL